MHLVFLHQVAVCCSFTVQRKCSDRPDYVSFLASCASLCIARFGRFQFLQFIYYLLQCRCCRIFHEMSKTKIFWSGEENVVAKEREAEISSFEVRTIWKFY